MKRYDFAIFQTLLQLFAHFLFILSLFCFCHPPTHCNYPPPSETMVISTATKLTKNSGKHRYFKILRKGFRPITKRSCLCWLLLPCPVMAPHNYRGFSNYLLTVAFSSLILCLFSPHNRKSSCFEGQEALGCGVRSACISQPILG